MNSAPILMVLFIASFVLTPTTSIIFNSQVIVLNIHSDDDIVVFIDALYPDGFKNIGRARVKGIGSIQLKIGDLTSAWIKERENKGRYSPVTLRLVAYDRYGLVSVRIVRVKHNRIIELYMENRNKQLVNASLRTSTRTLQLDTVEPLVSAIRVLEDSYEWNETNVLAMLNLDATTYGTLHYLYSAYREMGFTVYAIVPEIQLAGWVAYSKSAYVNLQTAAPTGGKAYVWMTFEYRWEKWRVYGPGLPPEGYIEEYVYVKDFYPNTAGSGNTVPSNASFSDIDSWNTSVYQATQTDLPYFQATYGTLEYRYSSIDLTAFADLLLALGKITSSTWSSIITAISSIGVDSYIEGVQAYAITVDLFSTVPGSHHEVSIGKDNIYVSGFNYFPVYYVETVEK